MNDDSDEQIRAYGVTFGALKQALREHRYPVTVAELVEQYGGFELETPTGTETVESALRACEASTFTEPWEVRDAVVEGVSVGTASNDASETDANEVDERSGNGEEATVGDWSQLSV